MLLVYIGLSFFLLVVGFREEGVDQYMYTYVCTCTILEILYLRGKMCNYLLVVFVTGDTFDTIGLAIQYAVERFP